MKLSLKIFLGIFVPSMISIFIISNLLINKYIDSVIELEIEKSYQEYKNTSSLIKSDKYDDEELKILFEDIKGYFKNKKIEFSFYRENELIFSTNNKELPNNKLLDVTDNKYYSIINEEKQKHVLYVSVLNDSYGVMVFNKNIDNIYESKNKLINICLITCICLVLIILIVAYIISKTLTSPLKKIEKEVKKVSNGDYDINIKEGKDEIGSLAHLINKMSSDIKNRNNELVELIDSKQLFIDNLSHEMNTPLTSIYGYIELFEKANLDDVQKYKALSYMKRETKRIIDMQKKLLMLSYKENTSIDKTNIDLNNIYDNLNIELKDKLDSKNINIKFSNNINKMVGDELLVSLAISNLIRNAINNSEFNTNIEVKSYEKDNSIYIDVIDEGCGISKEDIDKIIEPFYRVDKARSRKDGGAGLGLSIVKKIMNMHNGELIITSEIGKGSTFSLKFPL